VVAQVIYIGTDTRYIVALENGDEIAARLQNSSQRAEMLFQAGDRVRLSFSPSDARILAG
jgi:translation initiation factor IF-1